MHQQKKNKLIPTGSIYVQMESSIYPPILLLNINIFSATIHRKGRAYTEAVNFYMKLVIWGKKMKRRRDVDHFSHCFVSLVQAALYTSGRTYPLVQELDNAAYLGGTDIFHSNTTSWG